MKWSCNNDVAAMTAAGGNSSRNFEGGLRTMRPEMKQKWVAATMEQQRADENGALQVEGGAATKRMQVALQVEQR
jgi:hypothetical protein